MGALLISDRQVHAFSDHGEGNFYGVRSWTSPSPGRWRLETSIGIDTMPGEVEAAEPASLLSLQLRKGVLYRREDHGDGVAYVQAYERCDPRVPAW